MITISGAFFVHPRVITLFNIWLQANKLNPTGWLSKKRVTLIYWLFVASSPLSFTKLYKLQSDGGHPKFAALIYKHGRGAKMWGYRDTSAILCNVLKYYTVVNYGPQMESLYETNEGGVMSTSRSYYHIWRYYPRYWRWRNARKPSRTDIRAAYLRNRSPDL